MGMLEMTRSASCSLMVMGGGGGGSEREINHGDND